MAEKFGKGSHHFHSSITLEPGIFGACRFVQGIWLCLGKRLGAILVCSERAVIMEPFFTVLKQAVRSDGTHPSQAGDSDGPDDPDGLDDSNDSAGSIGNPFKFPHYPMTRIIRVTRDDVRRSGPTAAHLGAAGARTKGPTPPVRV